MKRLRNLIASILLTLTLIVPSCAMAQDVGYQATVSWVIPNTKTDGSTLKPEQIGGYELRYKKESSTEYQSVIITQSSRASYPIDNLESGKYGFSVATYDKAGLYSAYSEPAYKTFGNKISPTTASVTTSSTVGERLDKCIASGGNCKVAVEILIE